MDAVTWRKGRTTYEKLVSNRYYIDYTDELYWNISTSKGHNIGLYRLLCSILVEVCIIAILRVRYL